MVKLTPIFVVVVLIFLCYTLFLIMNRPGPYEAMDNPPSCLGPITEEAAPSCGSGSTDTGSNVPGCYNTVRGDAYNGFMSDFMSSDYILKTQMVTPVCPNNPIGEVGTEYGKEERIVTPEDDKVKGVTKKDAAKTDYDPAAVKPEVSNIPSFLTGDLFGQGTTQGTTQGSATQGSATQASQGATQSSNTDVKNTYLLNAPTTTVKPDKAVDARGSCPPCPACQRCPEPVVECKRVVNYNAAGMSNLPVPMIADFSKF
jgi:hypothetical protein